MTDPLKASQVTPSEALPFLFAGRCKFTLLRTDTGNRITFQFKKIKPKRGKVLPDYYKDSYWVLYKYNEDPTDNRGYALIGTIYQAVKYVQSRKLNEQGNRTAEAFAALLHGSKVMQWFVPRLITGTVPDSIQIWHTGCCGRCGRDLIVPISINRGIGPECIKYMPSIQGSISALILEYLENQRKKAQP